VKRAHGWNSTQGWHGSHANRVEEVAADLSLGFVFRSSVLTRGSCLLLQSLLLRGVGEAKLDQVFFSAAFRKHRSVVELPDDVVADVTSLKPGERRQLAWVLMEGDVEGSTLQSQRHVHVHCYP